MQSDSKIPIVELTPLVEGSDPEIVADQIGQACRNHGFFYVTAHGIDEELTRRLEQLSRQFFAQDLEAKMAIRMELGGLAWRGYFPVGDEFTSGQPDQKEGLYFGAELADDHPKVKSGVPLHGCNLFPAIPDFRETVLQYMAAMTQLGHTLMQAIALSLQLEASYFAERYTRDPLILFRIFHYPALSRQAESETEWSVGEHTDYGILTILRQDDSGGLQVKSQSRWIDAPPVPGALVCNIGDMLDRMTGGLYRSTPHRVRNRSDRGRLSFPFFFDPNFDAEVRPINPSMSNPSMSLRDDRDQRWDQASVHELSGTYGDYVLKKVAKVFPDLESDQL
jgi:isopenicillin N synthase-like dioxygenase